MNKDWHSGHFCCWQCDESLTGQRYVLRDDHPYCIKCYESVFANPCDECDKTIGIDSKVCPSTALIHKSSIQLYITYLCNNIIYYGFFLRICRTRINIGMKLVSCAANVASRWWTNNLDQK
jgi:hypothetical protein